MPNDKLILHRLRLARAFMDEHYELPLDLEQIAGQASFSRFHFLRLFRGAFDLTPHQYLTQRRIARAKEPLAQHDLSVTQVCFAVEFVSPPQEQFYGVEAIFKDGCGNWFSLTQHN